MGAHKAVFRLCLLHPLTGTDEIPSYGGVDLAKLAKVLQWIVTVVFILMLALLFYVPYLTGIRAMLAWTYAIRPSYSFRAVLEAWKVLFGGGDVWRTVLAWFMLFCGVCAAVILWQARNRSL